MSVVLDASLRVLHCTNPFAAVPSYDYFRAWSGNSENAFVYRIVLATDDNCYYFYSIPLANDLFKQSEL
jgi:hypothetical protein